MDGMFENSLSRIDGEYGRAAETVLTVKDIVKLQIYVDMPDREGFENPYEVVSDAEAAAVANNPERLPRWLRDFIRLQHEIAFEDTGEMLCMITPTTLVSKYAIKGKKMQGLEAEEKYDYIRRFLEVMRRAFEALFEVGVLLQVVKDKYRAVKDSIDEVLEQLDGEEAEAFRPIAQKYKNELAEVKARMDVHEQTLTSGRMPEADTVQDIQQSLERKSFQIDNIFSRFKNKLSRYRDMLGTKKPAEAALALQGGLDTVMHTVASEEKPMVKPEASPDILSYGDGLTADEGKSSMEVPQADKA